MGYHARLLNAKHALSAALQHITLTSRRQASPLTDFHAGTVAANTDVAFIEYADADAGRGYVLS